MAVNAPTNIKSGSVERPEDKSMANAPSLRAQTSWLGIFLTCLPYVIASCIFLYMARALVFWWDWEYTKPESYYSHGPIIPFMACFIVWASRDKLKDVDYKIDWKALFLLLPMLAILVAALKFQLSSIQSISFIGTIWGCIWFALGRQFVKSQWFAILFLALMMPLPGPILNDATLSLQSTSTALASKLLNLVSFSNVREGNLIVMNNFTLFVDVPCSGFKTLLALFTFNAFLAAVLDGPLKKRILLFLLCAPMALVINAVRITLIGIVGECAGSSVAHVFHDYSGLIMLSLGFFVLFSIARLLGCKKFAGLAIFS